jgi:hypothetical protein
MNPLNWFRKAPSTSEESRAVQYIESSAAAISKIHFAGGYSLSAIVLAVAIIVIALIMWRFIEHVGQALPYLIAFAAFIALLGFAQYVIESGRKQKLIERAFT